MSELKERILRGVFMENDWKIYRIGNTKTHELHYIDGEEHIYDYDENRMLTETEKNAFLYSNGNQYERHASSLKRSKPYEAKKVEKNRQNS